MDNLFNEIPQSLPEELVEILVNNHSVRIERIVSTGQSSAEGFWYDQEENEWVVVLQGQAGIGFETGEQVTLKPGDHILIQAHQKHRVEWTSQQEPTVWLAVFYND